MAVIVRKKRPSWKDKFETLFDVVFTFLIALILVFAALQLWSNYTPGVQGFKLLNVLTNSMVSSESEKEMYQQGGFQAGDVIVVMPIKENGLHKGDVITFHPSNGSDTLLTHRIRDLTRDKDGQLEIVTQGDANNSADKAISFEQIVGKKVLTIPKLGGWMMFLKTNWLFSVGAFVGIYLIFRLLKYLFFG